MSLNDMVATNNLLRLKAGWKFTYAISQIILAKFAMYLNMRPNVKLQLICIMIAVAGNQKSCPKLV